VLLLSTYELGHQPFGLASPAAWLRGAGADVQCYDLSVDMLTEAAVRRADLIAFYLPMHTATRMAAPMIEQARAANPGAHLCAYGLYAPPNADMLRERGVGTVLGGEFEEPLRHLCIELAAGRGVPKGPQTLPMISLGRQTFVQPDRTGLPDLSRYAHLRMPDGSRRLTGYTEATRGCKHLCRHCPVVPVYGGRFRVVQSDVVADDIAELVRAGAQHITFGDPDFLNAPKHAIKVVRRLASDFPSLTYDITVKVEHLVKHAKLLPEFSATGCVLVTSAVESFDDDILEIFDKRHSRADLLRAIELLAESGLVLNPTFVAFTPWTTAVGYVKFLTSIYDLGLVGTVAAVQYAIRLLIPAESRLLEVPGVGEFLGEFDADRLCFDWRHPDPVMDHLQSELFAVTEEVAEAGLHRGAVFDRITARTAEVLGGKAAKVLGALPSAAAVHVDIPHLSEPWFCCAEPVKSQLMPLF
jgi:hypothetical protein